MIQELDLADNATPRQSLRALVYRVRKDIGDRGGTQNFIYTERGGYGFNPDSNYWLDCLHFKGLISKANNDEKQKEKVISYLKQALRLYKGSFLHNQNLENNYLLHKREKYRELYLNTVQQAAQLLKNYNKYDQVIDLYETALQLYPLNVDLYMGLIETLERAEKPGLARIRAEEALSFLRNAGIKVPARLEETISKFFQINLKQNPEFVLRNNSEKNDKVFECGPLTFSNIYNLEKRRLNREKKDIYLIHFKLSNSSIPRKLREAEKTLRNTLQDYLRSSDVVTRWESRHYLQLAIGLTREEIDKILNRIEEEYQDQYPPPEVSLSYKYEKI